MVLHGSSDGIHPAVAGGILGLCLGAGSYHHDLLDSPVDVRSDVEGPDRVAVGARGVRSGVALVPVGRDHNAAEVAFPTGKS